MKIGSKLQYEELQIKFDFRLCWPTFSSVIALCSKFVSGLIFISSCSLFKKYSEIMVAYLNLLGPVGDLYWWTMKTHCWLLFVTYEVLWHFRKVTCAVLGRLVPTLPVALPTRSRPQPKGNAALLVLEVRQKSLNKIEYFYAPGSIDQARIYFLSCLSHYYFVCCKHKPLM